MVKALSALPAALVLLASAPPVAAQEAAPGADPQAASPVGYWRTISDTNGEPRALVEIVSVPDGTLEAYVRGSLVEGEDPFRPCTECKGDLEGAPMMGLRIMWDMEPKDDAAKYGGGRILDPDTGNVYKSKLTLAEGGDALKVRGFIGISMLGRSQEWLRASPGEAAAIAATAGAAGAVATGAAPDAPVGEAERAPEDQAGAVPFED